MERNVTAADSTGVCEVTLLEETSSTWTKISHMYKLVYCQANVIDLSSFADTSESFQVPHIVK